MRRRTLLAVALAAPLAGCDTAAPVVVRVRDLRFTPPVVTVPVGGTVSWQFDDEGLFHHVQAEDGSFDTEIIGSGSVEITFTATGEHPYSCSIHPYMTGTVVVR